MGLGQLYLVSGLNKVDEAIARIKQYEPSEGYILAFSGGKDSVVLKRLAIMAEVKFESHYCRTGIDPPELVRFIRQEHPDVEFIPPLMTMWKGILIHGLPLRQKRFCCQILKEHDGDRRTLLMGLRWAESARRRKRWDVKSTYSRNQSKLCHSINKVLVNPIIDWSNDDIWEYIREFKVPYCSLYDNGFKRLGCVLCPFTSGNNLRRELERYPKIADAYRHAAQRYISRRKTMTRITSKKMHFESGDEYFNWWLKERL